MIKSFQISKHFKSLRATHEDILYPSRLAYIYFFGGDFSLDMDDPGSQEDAGTHI